VLPRLKHGGYYILRGRNIPFEAKKEPVQAFIF
jgi:hypothetical protein